MKRARKIPAIALGATAFVGLSGCAGVSAEASEAADSLYAECAPSAETESGEDTYTDLVRSENGVVAFGPRGELAREYAEFDGDFDSEAARIAIRVLLVSNCLLEESDYPGTFEDLEDGESWEGWRVETEAGAGAEYEVRFIAEP